MATIRQMFFHWVSSGNSSQSVQINFGRAGAVGRVNLSTLGGRGRASGGITQFRTRPDPNGGDIDNNQPLDLGVPIVPIVAADNMTSVTAVLNTENATVEFAVMTLTVDVWG